jgi:hypothetical protein
VTTAPSSARGTPETEMAFSCRFPVP